jgi:hypothetical protein
MSSSLSKSIKPIKNMANHGDGWIPFFLWDDGHRHLDIVVLRKIDARDHVVRTEESPFLHLPVSIILGIDGHFAADGGSFSCSPNITEKPRIEALALWPP